MVDSTQQIRRTVRKREQAFPLIRGKPGVIPVLNEETDHEEIWGNGNRASDIYITLALVGCEQSASCPSHVCLTQETPVPIL